MTSTLLVPLSGPMQSWGTRSRFDHRDTHVEPTKSGVIGLLCSALGVTRSEPLDALNGLRFGARVDVPGEVTIDFHTAQDVPKADGPGKSTVVSRRYFLADAAFLVGLESDDEPLLGRIEEALRNPVWALYLGRKSFPLGRPPYFPGGSIRVGLTLEGAFCSEPFFQRRCRYDDREALRYVVESDNGEIIQSSQPESFDRRSFGLCRMTTGFIDIGSLPEATEGAL